MLTNSSRIDTIRDATTALVLIVLFAIIDLFPRLLTFPPLVRALSTAPTAIVAINDVVANAEAPVALLVLTLRFGFDLFA